MTGSRWKRRRLPDPVVRRVSARQQFYRRDRCHAQQNLLRIRRLFSSTKLIPANRDYAGSSHRLDYSIRTLPLTESSSNSGGSSSSSVASSEQQIIQRKRIHPPPPPYPSAGKSTGPMYAVRWIYKIGRHYVGIHSFLPQLPGDGPPLLAGQRGARCSSASTRRPQVH